MDTVFEGIDRGLENLEDCRIPINRADPYKPIPFGMNESKDDFPHRKEYRVDPGDFLRFACDSGRILRTHKEVIEPEIIMQCRRNNTMSFRHETVYYDDFSCLEFPSFADAHVNSSARRHLKREIGKGRIRLDTASTPSLTRTRRDYKVTCSCSKNLREPIRLTRTTIRVDRVNEGVL